jgi:hypothetical protein
VVEQLPHVCRLNAWVVMGVCLGPVPRATAAGIKLEVTTSAQALDIDATP